MIITVISLLNRAKNQHRILHCVHKVAPFCKFAWLSQIEGRKILRSDITFKNYAIKYCSGYFVFIQRIFTQLIGGLFKIITIVSIFFPKKLPSFRKRINLINETFVSKAQSLFPILQVYLLRLNRRLLLYHTPS